MKYTDFIRVAQAEDSRNFFGTCNRVNNVPSDLVLFFKTSNPIDVEVNYPNIGSVKFYPIEELEDLQHDYELPNDNFVFATCNGDPIFTCNGKVLMTLPEVFRPEKIAESFDEFIHKYVSSQIQ